MRTLIISLLAVFLIPLTAASETYEEAYFRALKSKTPNELTYWIGVNDICPFEKESVESIVEGVFIRSRVKPIKNVLSEGSIYLDITVDCLDRGELNPIFKIDISFARWRPFPAVKFQKGYGNFGVGDRDFILQTVQRGVENAVTDHIKANFDL